MKALLLDLDGTLADSLPRMRNVFSQFINRYGGNSTELQFERFNGPPLIEIVGTIREALGISTSVPDLLGDYEAIVDTAYRDIAPVEGAAEFVKAACKTGRLVAVVTSNTAERTHRWLERAGLAQYCATVVSGNDVVRGKPQPDAYLEALLRLGLDAADAVGVEDSAQGAHAAVAAGLRTFGYQPVHRPVPNWLPTVTPFTCFGDLQRDLLGM